MKKIINLLLKSGIIVAIFASILPNIFPNNWFIDILSNFKLQLVIFLLLLFVLNIFLQKSRAIGIILLILIFWNVSFISSLYYPSKFIEINKLKGVSMASVNLLSSNNEFGNVIDFIEKNDPDILILLEYNPKWESELSSITNRYSFIKKEVRNDNFGIGFFSKIESKTSILRFDHNKIPSIRADLEINKKPITIVATHPFPPVGQKRFESRNFHLKTIGKRRNEFSENLIIIGDLNTSSFSQHFKTLIQETRLRDSRNGFGILPTWPSNFKLLQTTLDHFLVSENISVVSRNIGKNLGSDHLPIFMEFRITE